MRSLLVLAAAFGLSTAAASACPFQKSVQSDSITVASVDAEIKTMSTMPEPDASALAEPSEEPAKISE